MVNDAHIEPACTERESPAPLHLYAARALHRPRAWLLFYVLVLLPSLVAALLIALPLLNWARTPLFREAISERSLDLLFEFFTGALANMYFEVAEGAVSPGPPGGLLSNLSNMLSLFSICGVLLIWPLLGMLWVYLEGGALATYAAPEPPGWSLFWQSCRHWFGPFLLLNALGVLLTFIVGAAFVAVGALLSGSSPLLGWLAAGLGFLLAGALATWVELARAVAVVRDERNVSETLKDAWRVIVGQPLALLALVAGGLVGYGLLFLARRGLGALIPLHWWLLTLFVQQIIVAGRLGVRLARQAGEVGLVMQTYQR